MKKEIKKNTVLESIAILFVLAVFLIVVIPNSFIALNSDKQNQMRKYAKNIVKETKIIYEEEISSNKNIGYEGSKFKWLDFDKYVIKIKDIDSKNKKYKGCILVDNTNKKMVMFIYLYGDGLMYDGILSSGLNAKDIPTKDIIKPKSDEQVIENLGKYQAT